MTTSATVEILGIRHHGPGSARSVRRALDEHMPSVVVIEGPPELDTIAPLANKAGMAPPVAGLVYDVKEPRRASFYPLAVFSPEWVALTWALDHGVAVHFADLPATNRLAKPEPDAADEIDSTESQITETGSPHELINPEPTGAEFDELDLAESERPESEQSESELRESELAGEPAAIDERTDPIGALAEAAGYDDAERWWEDAIEQRSSGDVLSRFAAVCDAMREFRDNADPDVIGRDQLFEREAAMRKILRKVVKAATGPVAVVCGAFHAPVLHPDDWPSATSDNALLKGLPKTKVAATWAPWTSARLAYQSGYGAGVTAPRWYEHLFTVSDDAISHWMVNVARHLRDEGYDASAASAVEATRLAQTLASLRGRPVAGLAEVNDAALTVLGQGSTLALDSISTQLFVGSTLGTVPDETPLVPLAEDLARHQRTLRLKPSAEQKLITVDLRQPSQLARSVLLRRLAMLGIPWGIETATGRTGGTFKEAWQLEWQPELAVAVIEASLHGTTVESAAAARVVELANEADSLEDLAELVESCLLADLAAALDSVLSIMSMRTAVAPDQRALMLAIEPLARTRRYGDVRGVDTIVVLEVLTTMVVRASIGLPVGCVSLDDDAALQMRTAIESVDRGVSLVQDDDLLAGWRDALAGLSEDVHGSVGGSVSRILLDAGRLDIDEAALRMRRALSLAISPAMAAAWLDGFLAGDVALLLHDPQVFALIDEWLCDLDEADFEDLLPLIRRTFARFEKAERRQLGELVSRGASASTMGSADTSIDAELARPAVAKVAELLGLATADTTGTTGTPATTGTTGTTVTTGTTERGSS